MTNYSVVAPDPFFSDHSPLCMKVGAPTVRIPRTFKISTTWKIMQIFRLWLKTVDPVVHPRVEVVWAKLIYVNHGLKVILEKKELNNVEAKVIEINQKLLDTQNQTRT